MLYPTAVPLFLAYILLGLGLLTIVIGGIMNLIDAFRESVLWGLVVLFVPFGMPAFVRRHWDVAKKGFFVSIFGGFMVLSSVMGGGPQVQHALEVVGKILDGKDVDLGLDRDRDSKDVTAEIGQERDRVFELENKVLQATAELQKEYGALAARRTALKSDDTAAVQAFNVTAAAYTQRNADLKQLRDELAAAREKVNALLAERAKLQPAATPAPAPQAAPMLARAIPEQKRTNAKVVMYTTRTCPACAAAKRYMASKGVVYEERDVESSRDAEQEFLRLGGRAVPLILVDNDRMEGFNSGWLNQKLGL